MDKLNNVSTRGYLDFQGLGELKGRAARNEQAALRETAQQFEAMFLQMMLKSMRESIDKSDLLRSDHTDTFEGLFDREVSVALARRNSLGLADMLVQTQNRQMSSVSAADALQSREAAGTDVRAGRRLDSPVPAIPLHTPAPALAPLVQPGRAVPLNKPGVER